MNLLTRLLVDTGGKVSVALIHNLFDVWADLLVVSGDVCAFGVVDESVDVGFTVVVDAGVVSAALIAVVYVAAEAVLVDAFVCVADWSVYVLS